MTCTCTGACRITGSCEGYIDLIGVVVQLSDFSSEMAKFYNNKTVMSKHEKISIYNMLDTKEEKESQYMAASDMFNMAHQYAKEGNNFAEQVGLDAAIQILTNIRDQLKS